MSTSGANGATGSRLAFRSLGNLATRVLAALVLAPAVLAAIYAGGWIFALAVTVAGFIGLYEWMSLVGVKGRDRLVIAGILCLAAVMGLVLLVGLAEAMVVLGVWTAALLALAMVAGHRHFVLVGLGIPYVGVPLALIIWLREQPDAGFAIVLWLFLVVWATDIGGYFAGRAIGGPKLAPRISPKKTWAGLAGAAAAAAGVGALVAWHFQVPTAALALAAALGGVLAVVAQLGDLMESAVKRRFNAKDSGALIPGHGGILDRIDGLLAAAPAMAVVYFVFNGSAWQ